MYSYVHDNVCIVHIRRGCDLRNDHYILQYLVEIELVFHLESLENIPIELYRQHQSPRTVSAHFL